MRPEALLKKAGFGGEVRYGEPMSRHTSLGIGGPAEAMAFPAGIDELARLVGQAARDSVPLMFLGKGSNLLVLDGGIRGVVVNMSKMGWFDIERSEGASQVHAGAGIGLAVLVKKCAAAGLSGLEFAAGIPGTLGGAVVMNAGTGEAEMKDVLTGVTLVTKDGAVKRLGVSELGLSYRGSSLPEGSVVAEAAMALIPWPAEEVKERVAANIRRRKNTQPVGKRSAGSTFKNPPGYSAWKLIEMAGMKGARVGRAQVSVKHGNFLLNLGGATASEYKELMDLVKDTVKQKLNIELVPEIKIVGVGGR